MKNLLVLILAAISLTTSAMAATLGPDVAIMEIRMGKEKQTRQVILGLHDESAPYTVENFKTLVRKKFYNGLRFHRIFPNSFVQTGDPSSRRGQTEKTGTGGPGYTLPAEIKLKHNKGAVAMARLPDKINPSKDSGIPSSKLGAIIFKNPQTDGNLSP